MKLYGHHPKTNFSYLLIGIALFLIVGPIADAVFGRADGAILLLSYTTMLIIGVWGLHETKLLFNTGLALGVICVSITIADLLIPDTDLGLYLMGVLFIFQLMSIGTAFRYVFGKGSITLNRLFGGICLYLLLGLTWNILYVYAYTINPADFVGLNQQALANGNLYWEMTYFSFVTLTTLGYGDIQPVGAIAKVLAYSEAIVGELFIAVLIGALVGNYISSREAGNNN
ncbi:MAG: ion channel [Gammaproteobacteria bacterium]